MPINIKDSPDCKPGRTHQQSGSFSETIKLSWRDASTDDINKNWTPSCLAERSKSINKTALAAPQNDSMYNTHHVTQMVITTM